MTGVLATFGERSLHDREDGTLHKLTHHAYYNLLNLKGSDINTLLRNLIVSIKWLGMQ